MDNNTDDLFEKIKRGSIRARNQVVTDNMALARAAAYTFKGSPVSYEDLVSEGAMALIKAAEEFDPTRGVKFGSYAAWWIKSYMTKAINDTGTLIRLPADKNYKIRKAITTLKSGDSLPEDIQELMTLSEETVSIDSPINEEGTTIVEILKNDQAIRPDDGLKKDEMKAFLDKFLQRMPSREADVLKQLYGIGPGEAMRTLDIAFKMGISKERVIQLKNQGMKRVRVMNHTGHLTKELREHLLTIETTKEF